MSVPIIPIFYACDDNFIKYTVVSIRSLMENASADYRYRIHILHGGISREMMSQVLALGNDRFEISFDDVGEYLRSVRGNLPLRDSDIFKKVLAIIHILYIMYL